MDLLESYFGKEIKRLKDKSDTNPNKITTFVIAKAFFRLMQNIAGHRSPLVSKSLPVKLTIFVSFLFSMSKKNQYVLSSGTYCLLSGFLRHIAHILGFGSSVVNRASTIGFAVNRAPSVFDRLIYNGEQYLYELKNASNQALESFFSKDIRIKCDDFNYDMYDTDRFISGRSGIYFSLGYDNLLEYPIHDVTRMFTINHESPEYPPNFGRLTQYNL